MRPEDIRREFWRWLNDQDFRTADVEKLWFLFKRYFEHPMELEL